MHKRLRYEIFLWSIARKLCFCASLWPALTLTDRISILRHLRFGAGVPGAWEKVNAES